ncbi:MAG: Sua5/YciO/YrdC/YwlC family protein [Pseudomonadales bacterium]|nr:Sua5/YciO/YrdC/YwlC family protein [Pseudomonadales bacterium]
MSYSFRCCLASHLLDAGGIIAYPTEAVWGLGCDPFDSDAVEKLLWLKKRKPEKGLILVAASIEQLMPYIDMNQLDELSYRRLTDSWPGPYTWLVPHNGLIPDWISGGRTEVALRVSAHPVVGALCRHFGGPLVSTSANPSGLMPAKSATTVKRYFGNDIDFVVGGKLGRLNAPTPIQHVVSGKKFR